VIYRPRRLAPAAQAQSALVATEVREKFGLEVAQVLLGHKRADVTQVYAEKNLKLAAEAVKAMG
jgi:hypothetical protein